jgi:pyruvate,orthophosphate dikinase
MDEPRLVYPFDHPHERPARDLSSVLGGKGAGLAHMTALGIEVPPGFTASTAACREFLARGRSDALTAAIRAAIADLERTTGRQLGDAVEPLLVSVRSGAGESMPGMMDTVLNVGMTRDVERALFRRSGNEEFARDTARRAAESFTSIVGAEMPDDPIAQIMAAIDAVFRSWCSERATAYRERAGIDHDLGTAVTVQTMVFGNMGEDSGTGVAFSRHPSTGEAGLMGDFLVNAQGEDVVAGTHETLPLADMATRWPTVWERLAARTSALERDLTDMVDIEFTVERGRLWILQSRPGKRSAQAAFQIAVDMANDHGFPVDRSTAVRRCASYLDDPPVVTDAERAPEECVVAEGLAASPGRADGRLCVEIDEALRLAERGERVVLVRRETSPSDVAGMAVAVGLVTTLGGLVSHAAVVARSWALPAVVGARSLVIEKGGVRGACGRVAAGSIVTVDGENGRLLLGSVPRAIRPLAVVDTISAWARELGGTDDIEVGAASTRDVSVDDCLRVLGLKGMGTVTVLVEALGASEESITAHLSVLGQSGLVEEFAATRVRLTEDGNVRVAQLISEEASRAKGSLGPVLDDFDGVNVRFKELVTAWQIKDVHGAQVPNDHDDREYDQGVLGQLRDDVHPEITAVVQRAALTVERLDSYQGRLERALERAAAGDDRYVAHPLLDSYHTVWFELHEELIRLAGRDRNSEAAAGRA